MDIFNLDITSISLIGLLKILIKLFDLLSAKGNSEFQRGTAAQNVYITNCGKNTALLMNDLQEKTLTFLKNNFKKEDLLQISENINWEKQTALKEEPPKHSQNRAHMVR